MLIVNQYSGFGGGDNAKKINLLVDSNQADIDLNAYVQANSDWDGVELIDLTVTVDVGVQVFSNSTVTPALTVGSSWPINTKIKIVNNGEITGKGGASGGGNGGDAISLAYQTSIDNTNGEINGGGGGGNNGVSGGPGSIFVGGKLGCVGGCTSQGGAGGVGYGPNAETAGAQGTCCGDAQCGIACGTIGQAGGAKGQNSGGLAGDYITGNSFAFWINTGTRNGGVS